MKTGTVLFILLKMTARRWRNRLEEPLRLLLRTPKKLSHPAQTSEITEASQVAPDSAISRTATHRRSWGGTVYLATLLLALLINGFFLANTALISPADEAAYLTLSHGLQPESKRQHVVPVPDLQRPYRQSQFSRDAAARQAPFDKTVLAPGCSCSSNVVL